MRRHLAGETYRSTTNDDHDPASGNRAAAVEAVLHTNAGEGRSGREIKIRTELLVRESTGAAPRLT